MQPAAGLWVLIPIMCHIWNGLTNGWGQSPRIQSSSVGKRLLQSGQILSFLTLFQPIEACASQLEVHMKRFFLCLVLLTPLVAHSAETGSSETTSQQPDTQPQAEEPTLYDHYVVLKQMQEE